MQSLNRDRNSLNRWLRFRVLAQGATVAACVSGAWVFGAEGRKQRALEKSERKLADEERERMRFGSRLQEAEELQRLEDEANRVAAMKPAVSPEAAEATAPKATSWWRKTK